MALTQQEMQDWQNLTGNPYQGSSWTDYMPNVFGSAPSYMTGLLGEKETQALQSRANIGGLLGSLGALAQGMSSVGPRRSAAQNILSALGAGYGSAGQVYQQGLENFVTQQKINQMQLQQAQMAQKQNAINQMIQDPAFANDPVMKAWAINSPDDALKWFVKRRGMQQFLAREEQAAQPSAPQISPEAAAYQDQMAPYTVSTGANVVPMAEPMREPNKQLAGGTVETAPVPDISGQYGALPVAPAPTQQPAPKAGHPLDAEIKKADLLAKYWSGEGDDAVKAKEYQAIAKDLRTRKDQDVLSANVGKSIGKVNPLLQPLVDTLVSNAPNMTSAEIQSAAMDIRKKNSDFQVNTETELRKEYSSLPAIKEYSTVETAYKQINSALSNPSAANDLAAATKFMKLLDPGSVVRESELGMAMAATGVVDRVTNYFEKLKSGQILNAEQRADFKRSAALMFNAAKDTRDQISSQYVDLANSYNVNPNNVVIKSKGVSQESAQVPQRNTKGWQLSVDAQGNKAYVSPDGTQFQEVK